ncbi:MAG: RNA-guided pseudouridylation complex pseudouridine synthase subunit Cbf5 [Nanoarchaeota archaeon]|nr:RNA-guided pseudouridylation complex pseudouridine synthase subunit Cbf5 [Nanoarchaeota archaeon]
MQIDINRIKSSKTTKELLEFGIINLDKPSGPTSFTVSEFVCKELGIRKTSHFGTLDPKVTGVLPIALNRACKLTGFFLGENKTYVGIMRTHEDIGLDKINEIIKKKFMGKIKQTPPVKSRVKRVEREREIKRFDILEKKDKDFLFEVECQGGTYIRKLIDDLGKELGIGAHMLELRRTDAGIFSEMDKEFVNLYDFEKAVQEYKKGNDKKLREITIPAEIAAEVYLPVQIYNKRLKIILTGKPLIYDDLIEILKIEKDKIISVFSDGKFIGMYRVSDEKEAGIFARPEFVMQPI